MKSIQSLLQTQFPKFFLGTILFTSLSAFALSPINESALLSDKIFHASSNGYVAYVDESGRLFSVKTDGSSRKNISKLSENETEADRLMVLAKMPSEFVIVESAQGPATIYFQARENPRSFRLFFYKVDLLGASAPVKLFQLVKPVKQIKVNSDQSKLYLSGDDRHSVLDLITGEKVDLNIKPVAAAPYKISDNFEWLAYVSEYRVQNQRSFELLALNLQTGENKTLLQGQDRYHFNFEFSKDSSVIAVQEIHQGSERLLCLSLSGSDVNPVFPTPGGSVRYTIEDISFMPGIRGAGDTGALIFSARDQNQVKKVYIADLLDLSPRALDTREAQGESIGQIRISPNFETLVFQRVPTFEDPMITRPRTYSLSLMDPAARPVFLFENDFQHWEFLADSSAIVFVSSGGFYAKNQIVSVSLDGTSSRVLSAAFPEGWMGAQDVITRLSVGFGKTLFVSLLNTQSNPARYSIKSFENN